MTENLESESSTEETSVHQKDQTITVSFDETSNREENLRKINNILKNEKDIKTVEIQYFDHNQNKTYKIKVLNSLLQNSPIKKKIKKNSPIKPSSSNGNKKNLHRNAPKILGKAIIDFCYSEKNLHIIERIIKKIIEKTHLPSKDLNVEKLIQWIKDKRLENNFHTIQCFKTFWTVEKNPQDIEQAIEKVFRDICEYFLLFEANRLILEKFCGKGNKEMKYDNAFADLQVIPKLIRGIKDPENFSCLK